MFTTVDIPTFENEAKQYYDSTGYEWEFSQMFGEEDEESSNDSVSTGKDNLITALSFDKTGKYLSVGYNSGQVVVLCQQDDHTYQLYTEFKSHESTFDFLTSLEIEEKINMIRWYPFNTSRVQHLLTTNDKTIKLFKIWQKTNDGKIDVNVKPRKVYEGAHSYNINSLAFNSDGETFVSSDDLRIYLWNIEVSSDVFEIVDIKPENMDNLSEIITYSALHPRDCNSLIFGTSKGTIKVADLRTTALCQTFSKEFEDVNSDIGGFFKDLVTSISCAEFSPNGQFVVSRDYLTMKIWDSRMEKKPLRVVKFHDHLISKLCDLYENECIFDKFNCSWDNQSARLLTGSYNNNFYICDAFSTKVKNMTAVKPGVRVKPFRNLDYTAKALHTSWHPKQDIIAVGARDFGFLYLRRNPEGN